nr:MAG TPA: hypothetical protein [Caudoviricetes sp.]
MYYLHAKNYFEIYYHYAYSIQLFVHFYQITIYQHQLTSHL